jgi:hypothetical protein
MKHAGAAPPPSAAAKLYLDVQQQHWGKGVAEIHLPRNRTPSVVEEGARWERKQRCRGPAGAGVGRR